MPRAPQKLTDFAGAQVPSIPMCTLSDLTSFTFGDIINKLTLLFEARLRCRACLRMLTTDAVLPTPPPAPAARW